MRFTVAAVASFTLLSSVSAGLPFGQLLSPGGGIPVVGGLIPGQTAGSGNVVACGNMLGSVLNVGALNTNTCGSTGNNQAGGNAIYCGNGVAPINVYLLNSNTCGQANGNQQPQPLYKRSVVSCWPTPLAYSQRLMNLILILIFSLFF
ncbi:hypothetical protein Pst134EB_031129 [Puccinia striiformis f. sp. tritici]|nr:hypothetical protein Pst134EB_031129 [Puccinia striiformis f. sp. tritici]